MARVLITGSAEGLGLMSGRLLADQGHAVTLHARSEARADDARRALPQAEQVLIGDVSTIAGMRSVAEQANSTGRFDAVIHNVGIDHRGERVETVDGLQPVFAVNVLAPYLMTALMSRPDRLIYLSSNMHYGADPDLDDPQFRRRRWSRTQAYSDSKLYVIYLAFGVARRWPDVRSNSVDPGWVPTRMGGRAASDSLELGPVTQAWLAVSTDRAALVTGQHLYHQRPGRTHPAAGDVTREDALLDYCVGLTGVTI